MTKKIENQNQIQVRSSAGTQVGRREFLGMGAVGIGLWGSATSLLSSSIVQVAHADKWAGFKSPPPAGKKIAEEGQGIAKAQAYAHFAKNYKGTKTAKMAADSNCLNCNFYKPQGDIKNWGACTMLGNSWVYEEGMCKVYQKKA